MEKRRSDVTEDELLFDAVLYPHRSLNSLGFRLLMLGVILISFLVGGLFFAVGAWPVIGFLGLDVLLIYLAFQISYRSATLFERIKLSRKELVVQRILPRGKVYSWSFKPPHWVRVTQSGAIGNKNDRIVVSSHGSALFVGDFLRSDERRSLAVSLRMAIVNLNAVAD